MGAGGGARKRLPRWLIIPPGSRLNVPRHPLHSARQSPKRAAPPPHSNPKNGLPSGLYVGRTAIRFVLSIICNYL